MAPTSKISSPVRGEIGKNYVVKNSRRILAAISEHNSHFWASSATLGISDSIQRATISITRQEVKATGQVSMGNF